MWYACAYNCKRRLPIPLITLVMAVLAIPFALSTGKRSALAGVATAIGIGVFYWTINGLFEAMGNLSQLPPRSRPGPPTWSLALSEAI